MHIVDRVRQSLEFELQASAAGYPGADDDSVTYIISYMLEQELKNNKTNMLYSLCEKFNIEEFSNV
jgi:hypothetical protein